MYTEIFVPVDNSQHSDWAVDRAIELARTSGGRAIIGQLSDGPAALQKEVLVNAAPLLVGGVLRGSVGVVHDVSEIRRLSEELASARRRLRQRHHPVVPYPGVRVAGVEPDGVQQAHLLRSEAASGDAEQVELDPIHILKLGMQVMAAENCATAGKACSHASFKLIGILL